MSKRKKMPQECKNIIKFHSNVKANEKKCHMNARVQEYKKNTTIV